MMVDMPAGWQESVKSIDIARLEQTVRDYGPAIKVISDTWTKESLQEIADGNLFVSDDTLNAAIARQVEAQGEDAPVRSLTLASHENGRLDLTADTRKAGVIELSGTIEEFVHEGDKSEMKYRVRSRNIRNHGLMSWIFSRISLSMAEKMVGKIKISDDIPVSIHHNTVTVDYSKTLAESDFGKTEIQGHRLLDMIRIEGAVPREGGIMFKTRLDVPEDLQQQLKNLL